MKTKSHAVLFFLWYFKCYCCTLRFKTYLKEEQQVKVDSGLGKGIQGKHVFHLMKLSMGGWK